MAISNHFNCIFCGKPGAFLIFDDFGDDRCFYSCIAFGCMSNFYIPLICCGWNEEALNHHSLMKEGTQLMLF